MRPGKKKKFRDQYLTENYSPIKNSKANDKNDVIKEKVDAAN